MLEINQLKFRYPSVDSLNMLFDLEVKTGEVLTLIGPSGSGKSTLLNLIAGFAESSDGSIRLDGEPIENLPADQRPLSIVFQQHNLFPHLDCFTNIALGINSTLKLSDEQMQLVDDAVQTLGLIGLERRKPGALSGGQQQRVALARAMVRERKVLLLDEAFAALGPALRAELIEWVVEWVANKEMVGLLVSHQPNDAMIASKRTAFVDRGQIVALMPTEELLQASGLTVVENYLGSI